MSEQVIDGGRMGEAINPHDLGVAGGYIIEQTMGERLERLKVENAKLRKVCKRMHDLIKDSCGVCDEYYCSSWDEDNECCVFDSYMRELGVDE